MKMKPIALIAVSIAFVVSGCGSRAADDQSGIRPLVMATVVKDKETGCEYVSNGSSGMYPRLGRDGKQICR